MFIDKVDNVKCHCVPIFYIVNAIEMKIFPYYIVNTKNMILKFNMEGETTQKILQNNRD